VKSLLYEEASCAVERKAMGVVGAHYLLNPSHANMDEGPIVGQQSSVFAGDSVGAAHWSRWRKLAEEYPDGAILLAAVADVAGARC